MSDRSAVGIDPVLRDEEMAVIELLRSWASETVDDRHFLGSSEDGYKPALNIRNPWPSSKFEHSRWKFPRLGLPSVRVQTVAIVALTTLTMAPVAVKEHGALSTAAAALANSAATWAWVVTRREMSKCTGTSTTSTRGIVHLDARVPIDIPDTVPESLYKQQERAYLVELHKFGDVDDTGRIWNHHYVAVYATVTGQRAVRIRVDEDATLRATRPIHERGGSLVSWPARRRFQRRVLELYIDDGDPR